MKSVKWGKYFRWTVAGVFGAAAVWLLLALLPIELFEVEYVTLPLRLFGFGTAVLAVWGIVLCWMTAFCRASNLYRRWNRWLGALLLSAVLMGAPVLIDVSSFDYRGIALDAANETLGGLAGRYITGDLGPGFLTGLWRLIVAGVVAVIIVFPLQTWQILRRVAELLHIRRQEVGVPPVLQPAPFVADDDTRISAASQTQQSAVDEHDADFDIPLGEHVGDLSVDAGTDVTEAAEQSEKDVSANRQDAAAAGPIGLLDAAPVSDSNQSNREINEKRAQIIEQALSSYGVDARVIQVNPGPTVTQFGIEPGWDRKYKKIIERDFDGKIKRDRNGSPIEYFEEISRTRVKVERITSLANDLALALAAPSIRFEAPVPGKSIIGLEVPNEIKSIVSLRDCMESEAFVKASGKSKLALALGKGAGGEVVAGDLAQMPHLLIAGATGSGKTVCLSSVISCILVKNTPLDVRLLLIDPKRVELVAYNDIPHLISPVVVDMEDAISALRKITWEMDNRYKKFAAAGVNNLKNYNKKAKAKDRLPYLVVIIDELADLMSASADMVEPAICRIAQLSRATGIHVIIATQRPSVDVITGLIKANFPTRISFSVPSQIDSRTILDTTGAEKLLGSGDMLYFPIGASKPRRLRGAFVSDKEVARLVDYWKHRRDSLSDTVASDFAALEPPEGEGDEDPLLDEAKRLAIESNRISTSFLQRRLRIGYPRAARIMDMLEEEGIISPAEPGKPRQVLGGNGYDDSDDY